VRTPQAEAAAARVDLEQQRARLEAQRVEAAAELTKHAMSAIAELDFIRQQMLEDHPDLAPQLNELQQEAMQTIVGTLRNGMDLGSG
jgi:peptidyl-tRNA hydrolase